MNKALFKCFMSCNGDSVKTLAKALNIHPVTLYGKINGVTPFSSPEMNIIVKRWDLTGSEIKNIFFETKSA